MDSRETGRIFAFRVPDQSTAPEFKEGDLLIVNMDVAPRPGMFVAVDRPEEGVAIREYRVKGYDSKKLPILEYAAINPAYPSYSSAHEAILLVGVVIEHRRRLA
jgi:SOS-response transcriptional repressor LexA